MIRRCYSQKWKEKYKAYNDCSVCDEWFNYSAFRAWFNSEYQDGYELDKDILAHGNRVYSPTTCLLVPREINSMLISHRALRGRYPIGVYKRGNKYAAALSKRLTGGRICLGAFDTPETAFAAYKQEKEAYIKEVASAYYDQGKITEKVYAALMKYRVEITD